MEKASHLSLTSSYEGMPLSIIEAMFCKRVVITTDVAGHSEFIDDGINGYLAEASNYKLFSDTLENAWQERKSWKKIGETAFEKVISKSTKNPVEVFCNKIKNILNINI